MSQLHQPITVNVYSGFLFSAGGTLRAALSGRPPGDPRRDHQLAARQQQQHQGVCGSGRGNRKWLRQMAAPAGRNSCALVNKTAAEAFEARRVGGARSSGSSRRRRSWRRTLSSRSRLHGGVGGAYPKFTPKASAADCGVIKASVHVSHHHQGAAPFRSVKQLLNGFYDSIIFVTAAEFSFSAVPFDSSQQTTSWVVAPSCSP